MHRAIRLAAMMLSLLLVVAVPARAGSLRVSDVAQVVTGARNGGTTQLRLRNVSQTQNLVSSSPTTQNPASTSNNGDTNVSGVSAEQSTMASSPVAIGQDPSAPNIETIELGDVTGTICDCGEILIPGGGGFPLLPLLALGAIPLAFLDFGDRETFEIPPGPTPPPTPEQPIPEPATLFLLGTGLAAVGARARRRRRRTEACESQEQNANVGVEV